MVFYFFALILLSHGSVTEAMLGGVEVPIEQIPFQCSVETQGIHKCSAAVLSEKYIVLTGVCAEEFRVDPGIATFRFGTTSRLYDGEPYKCTGVMQHPQFDLYNNTYEQKDYDIAVAEIYPELEMDQVTISSIKLASSAPAVGTQAQISGWGSIKDGGAIMVYARARNITISQQTTCRTAFQDVFPVTERMMCAGVDNAGVTCDGDHGALLVTDGALVGLSSWGYGCAHPDVPDVYVNLANPEIRQFIQNATGISQP